MNTRFVGELPLDAPPPVAHPSPGPVPGTPETVVPPDRVEVTQPYIPAIRDERPEFAKRLNPDLLGQPPQAPQAPQARPEGTAADLAPAAPPGAAPPGPAAPAAAPPAPPAQAPPAETAPPAAPKRPYRPRSLARRVVRKIIGPDLLRKDPPKKKKKS